MATGSSAKARFASYAVNCPAYDQASGLGLGLEGCNDPHLDEIYQCSRIAAYAATPARISLRPSYMEPRPHEERHAYVL